MTNELTRPLGLRPPRRAARLGALGVAGAVLLAGLGATAAWVYLERPQLPEVARAPEIAAPTAPQTVPPAPAATRRGQEPAPAEIADSGLVEVEPDGSLEVPVPLPAIVRQEQGLAHMPDPELIEEGATGVIPKRSADGRRPMDVYSRPPATEGNFGVARVVIIVGGIGISQTGSQDAVRKLPGAVTLAFAPYGNSLQRWMTEARRKGHELLLQVPMEPFGYPASNPGPNTLLADVSAEENVASLHWAMSRVTNYVGVMNFLGGRMVTTPDALRPVFDELARRGLLFVDDGSARNSRTGETAAASLLPYVRAGIALDAERTRRDIAARLDELAKEAKRTGLAIGVANAFPESIELIAAFAAEADKLGIEITPVSAVVSDPERGRE